MTTFTVFYNDQDGVEQSIDIEFDTTGWTNDDFCGGAGQEAIEDILETKVPYYEWLYMEWDTNFEEVA